MREIPKTLREAATLMNGSDMLRAAFGDDVIDHYHHAAQWEISETDRVVTDFEIAAACWNGPEASGRAPSAPTTDAWRAARASTDED